MRPRSLNEFVGQQHFLGEGKLLRRLLQADRLGSVIFYGPPGTGKTTLALELEDHEVEMTLPGGFDVPPSVRQKLADLPGVAAVEEI